jgi:hypothetical protein
MKQCDERLYNVIWADDDIYTLASDIDIEDWRRDDHINIIARVATGAGLRSAMADNIEMVDAVIVDANFDANETMVDSERTISGLRRAFELHRLYNEDQKRGIPFFLYTGRRKEMLYDAGDGDDKKSLKELFEETGRWFDKSDVVDGLDRLFEKIKQEVDAVNTLEFKLRKQFAKEFNAARLIPDGQKWLMAALLFEFDSLGEYRSTKDYFNPARQIWEQIVDGCKERHLLPSISSINGIVPYLKGMPQDNFTRTLPIMHETLIHSLDYFLDITQDGSHRTKNLSLGVIDYVNNTKNTNLYRTVIYIVMDLLLWYQRLVENPPQEQLWSTAYIDEGEIKVYQVGRIIRYYVHSKEIYELKTHRGTFLPVGHKAKILSDTEHNNPFQVPEGLVKRVVFKYDIED